MTTEIFIDGLSVDTDSRSIVSVSVNAEKMTGITQTPGVVWKDISIPATPHNCALIGFAHLPLSPDNFNAQKHSLSIRAGESALFEGYVKFMGFSGDVGGGRLTLHPIVSSAGFSIAKNNGSQTLSALFEDYSVIAGGTAIQSSWDGTPLVKFLPVIRDSYDDSGTTEITVLSADDYHPFVHLASVVREAIAKSGYAAESSLFSDPLFNSLYFSGNYKGSDVSEQKSRMDFRAGRFEDVSASADRFGRVYCDPFIAANTIGNIVDSANPYDTLNGKTIEGVYDNGGCFSTEDGAITFTPKSRVTVGFEYDLHYTTGYRISDRNELSGFNSVSFGYGDARSFRLANTFTDCRGSFVPDMTYRCVIFDFAEGQQFRIMARHSDGSGGTGNVTVAELSSRSELVRSTLGGTFSDLTLYLKGSDGIYRTYAGDWALYYGSVEETGMREVRVKLTSAAEEIAPNSPKTFHNLFFGGAESHMNFTLHSDTTVRPVFISRPVQGSEIAFGDIAGNIRLIDILRAAEHMFCLRFYADQTSKTLCMEPEKDFYTAQTVDWTHKADMAVPLSIAETDFGANGIAVQYASPSGAVKRFNAAGDTVLGRWQASIGQPYADTECSTFTNPLFAPSLSQTGIHPSCPSALAINVGDRNSSGGSLNFDTRIVSWIGMQTLPADEKWDWPSYGDAYPLAAFVLTGSTADTSGLPSGVGVSLCFDDVDGIQGLNRFWRDRTERYRRSRELTVNLHLSPDDMEQILAPSAAAKGLRTLYSFVIDGETTLWTLAEIRNYSPSRASAECLFRQRI